MTSAPIAGKDDVRVTEEDRRYAVLRENYRDAWRALAMVREAIEGEIVGALPSGEHTGVTPTDEAEHLVAGILKIRAAAERRAYERCAEIADVWAKTEANLDASTNPALAKVIASVCRDTGELIATEIRALLNSTKE